MVILKDIICKYDWPQIQETLLGFYPDESENTPGYKNVLVELFLLKPCDSEFRLVCYQEIHEDGSKDFYVSGRGVVKEDTDSGGEERDYGIEFTPWQEWLGMVVDEETLIQFPEHELVAHCLWEMTFCGFTEKRRQEKERILVSRYENCVEQIMG